MVKPYLTLFILMAYPRHVDRISIDLPILYFKGLQVIRIDHECEGRIEKSIPKIAVWHHEACQVMTNGDPEGQIFLSYPLRNNGFIFLLTTVFIYLLNLF